MIHRTYRLIAALLVAAALIPGAAPRAAQAAVPRVAPDGARLTLPDGRPFFVMGYNYEGPSDRAWRMWQEWDPGLVAQDVARARAGGANTLRVFIQEPLPAEILAGDFQKLDALVGIAAGQGVLLLVTLSDYGERDLQQVAEVGRRIAERYRGNPTILAYDLRNEPQFITLGAALYPPGVVPPIQRADLVAVYGERVARADIPAYRAGGDGRVLPAWWGDDQVYAYANNLAYFRELLAEAERWVVAAPGRTIVDFPAAPEAGRWRPLIDALDATLAAWIEAQRAPIRSADPERMITVGWSNMLLAALPANRTLDFVSPHRYPRPGAGGVGAILDLGAALRRAHGRPVVFEEIGFATSEADPGVAATLELAVATRAYAEGYAGFLKWMLTDLPPVGNPREDTFGAVRTDGSPKPIFDALGAFGTYLTNTAAPPGGRSVAWDNGDGPQLLFAHRDAVYVGGRGGSAAGLTYRLDTPGVITLRKRGAIYALATATGEVTLDLRELVAPWTGAEPLVQRRAGEGWETVGYTRDGDRVTFPVAPSAPYRVVVPSAVEIAAQRPGCRFFPETGHNLCGAFLSYWQGRGGLAIFGLPLTEEFVERSPADGQAYTVQYFERNRFEYHPERAGTPYEVQLGLLGSDLAAGRRGEAPFVPVAGASPGRDFFPETGHTLGGVFREYWRRSGGLAVFGYPISEEFQEVNPADGRVYTVQYFERNRFEHHPEHAGTPHVVQLGLLGAQVVEGSGWR